MSSSDSGAFAQYLDLARSNADVLAKGRPALLGDLNAAGANRLEALAAAYRPAAGEINSCRLDTLLAPDYGVNIARVPMQADVAASFRCGVPQLNSLLAVVVNDIFRPTDTLLRNMPDGLTVCSLRDIPAQFTDDAAAMLSDTGASVADAVADALTTDGVYIRVAPHTEVEKAVQIVNIFNSPVAMLTPRRVLIHACEGAKVRVLLCDHTQSPATAADSDTRRRRCRRRILRHRGIIGRHTPSIHTSRRSATRLTPHRKLRLPQRRYYTQ